MRSAMTRMFSCCGKQHALHLEQREIIATVNKLFGSVLFTSDNVGDYNAQQMQLLLKTFAKDDIQVQRAEFRSSARRIIDIDYTENGHTKALQL